MIIRKPSLVPRPPRPTASDKSWAWRPGNEATESPLEEMGCGKKCIELVVLM